MADTITFHGEQYRLADRLGLMPLMRFAKVAQAGVDSDDMAGLTAMYDLIEQCIDPDEWHRFEAAATRHRDQVEELMAVVQQAIQVMSERPTRRSSVSSDGPPSTRPNSTGDSSSPVVRRLERKGRPDLALLVQESIEAQEARTAAS